MNTTMINIQKNVVNEKVTLNKARKTFHQGEMHNNGTSLPDH
jgi:hypothetical protein